MKTEPTNVTSPSPGVGFGEVAIPLFSTIFFARAWLISVWGSPAPYLDDWNGFALDLYRPWLDGTLGWHDILAAHNEHRIALTRLADLALFSALGRWNPWWQLLLNASLHAATAVALLGILWRHLDRFSRGLMALMLLLLFASTSGWQNALWGFQSQFYFCSLLSVLSLAGLFLSPPFARPWLLGWIAALLALFSTGGGVLAAAVAFGLGSLLLAYERVLGRRIINWRTIAPLLAILAIVLLGWILRAEVPDHSRLRAHTAGLFFAAFFRCLSWPWIDMPWMCLILHAPLLGSALHLLRHRITPAPIEQFLLGLGGLVVLHAAAVAWSRGASMPGGLPFSRYLDVQTMGTIANTVVLLRAATRPGIVRLAGLVWGGLLLAGLLVLSTGNLALNLPLRRAQGQSGLMQIHSYLTTHDPRFLTPEIRAFEMHPHPPTLQRVLDDPTLQPVLPREFTDATARPPWPIRYAPWFLLLSSVGLMSGAIICAKAAGNSSRLNTRKKIQPL